MVCNKCHDNHDTGQCCDKRCACREVHLDKWETQRIKEHRTFIKSLKISVSQITKEVNE